MDNRGSIPNVSGEFNKEDVALLRLRSQLISKDPTFPLGGINGLPYSWSFNRRLEEQFQRHLSALRKKGIIMKLGAELEFSLKQAPLEGHEDRLKALFDDLINKELDALPPALEDWTQGQKARAAEINSFLERDFLMLHLYERDEVIQRVFEHKFGKMPGGKGYYDNDNVFEFTTRIQEADTFFESYVHAQGHLLEQIFEYRFPLQGVVFQQLSISFWREGRNIFLAETKEDEDLSHKILSTFGEALTQVHPLYFSSRMGRAMANLPMISPSRFSMSRHAHGRIELKGFTHEAQHLMIGALVVAGVANAVIDDDLPLKSIKNGYQPSYVYTCGTKIVDDSYPWLRHAINASTINMEDGSITPDEEYIKQNARKILQQINPNDPAFYDDTEDEDVSPAWQIKAVSFMISSARIVKKNEKYQIKWPENSLLGITKNTVLDMDNFNESIECIGVSRRILYNNSGQSQNADLTLESARKNPLIRYIIGEGLTDAIIDARVKDFETSDIHFLEQEFRDGMFAAIKEPPTQNENGTLGLKIKILERPIHMVERGIKYLLETARKHPNIFGSIYKFVVVTSIELGQDGETATAYNLEINPLNYQPIRDHYLNNNHKRGMPLRAAASATPTP